MDKLGTLGGDNNGRLSSGWSPAMVATDNAAAFWLWIDPRLAPGYTPAAFDQAVFLSRAADLFQTKERWGGRPPAVVLAHPDQAENGLKSAAKALGLVVVSDPTVTAGTYRLGLASEKGGAVDEL